MGDAGIDDAIRLLLAHSTNAATLLRGVTPGSPRFQEIYNQAATQELGNPTNSLTIPQRELVARFITMSDSARSFMLRVRLTEAERAELQHFAAQEQLDMSSFVRTYALGPSDASYWRAEAVQRVTAAASQMAAEGRMTMQDFDALRPMLTHAQVTRDDDQLKALLLRFCPGDSHVANYPNPRKVERQPAAQDYILELGSRWSPSDLEIIVYIAEDLVRQSPDQGRKLSVVELEAAVAYVRKVRDPNA